MLGLAEPVVTAALVAAQATADAEGFRQRDVRFFVELFSNWLESTTGEHTLSIHNTQVQRCLGDLARVRWAKRSGRSPPRWTLTADGLVELLRRLVDRPNLARLDTFFLIHHFLDAYGPRLRALAEHGGAMASRLLAVDLEELVSPERLLERERARVKRELRRLSLRAEEARMASRLARARLAAGTSLSETIAEVEQQFPYELNSQRPLSELLATLPEPWRRAELVEASERRAGGLWDSQAALLRAYDGLLAGLAQSRAPARAR